MCLKAERITIFLVIRTLSHQILTNKKLKNMKRNNMEAEVIKCIENKSNLNPYINLIDISVHIFLNLKCNKKSQTERFIESKKCAEIIIKRLLKQNRIKIDNHFLGSYICC